MKKSLELKPLLAKIDLRKVVMVQLDNKADYTRGLMTTSDFTAMFPMVAVSDPHIEENSATIRPLVHVWYARPQTIEELEVFLTDMMAGLPDGDVEAGNCACLEGDLFSGDYSSVFAAAKVSAHHSSPSDEEFAAPQLFNLGRRDEQYGGTITDVSTLPVGTTFFVHNGWWEGKVVMRAGKLMVEVFDVSGKHITRYPLRPAGDLSNILSISLTTEAAKELVTAELCFAFHMDIGDWSGDGHAQCERLLILSNKPVYDVRKAHFAIKERLGFDIEQMCSEYEENVPTQEQIDDLRNIGILLPSTIQEEGLYADEMAEIWIALLMKADTSLRLEISEDGALLPGLHFSGYDSSRRHIGQIGYGLFK